MISKLFYSKDASLFFSIKQTWSYFLFPHYPLKPSRLVSLIINQYFVAQLKQLHKRLINKKSLEVLKLTLGVAKLRNLIIRGEFC